jgi:hypothetical protein
VDSDIDSQEEIPDLLYHSDSILSPTPVLLLSVLQGFSDVGSVHGLLAECWVQWKHHGSIRSSVELVVVLYFISIIVQWFLEM